VCGGKENIMKQVWKCDFCDKTGYENEINIHEPECINNPKLKLCWSCDFDCCGKCDKMVKGYYDTKYGRTQCELWEKRKQHDYSIACGCSGKQN
jgi:hypothetical protein